MSEKGLGTSRVKECKVKKSHLIHIWVKFSECWDVLFFLSSNFGLVSILWALGPETSHPRAETR